jgi:energy-converting hydrogenase Eha subunit E
MPVPATVDTISPASRRWRVDRWFYVGAAVLVIALNVAGFGPALIDQSRRNDQPSWLVIIHGLVAGAWILLFLAQATLVATGRTSIHRRLGVVAPALTIVTIVLIFQTTIALQHRGYDLSGDLLRPAFAPGAPVPPPAERDGGLNGFVFALEFGILVAAGWWYRRRPEIHKRLMLLALLLLTPVPLAHLAGYVIGRWPDLFGPARAALVAANLLPFAGAVHDKVTRGRIHPVSLWVPVGLFAVTALIGVAVRPSALWHQFAAWLAG